jgi:hypothetical protein
MKINNKDKAMICVVGVMYILISIYIFNVLALSKPDSAMHVQIQPDMQPAIQAERPVSHNSRLGTLGIKRSVPGS